MKNKYCDNIEKGDLIAVAYSHAQWLGVYIGRGQGNSIQYYSIIRLVNWFEKVQKYPKYNIYKNYIMDRPDRIIKISPDTLNTEWKEKYETALHALGKLKVI